MKKELYRRYRPRRLDDIVGQDDIVTSLENFVENDNIPHAIMLIGQSGCGKTTIARIIRRLLNCNKSDFIEDAPRKVDDVRLIKQRIHQAPLRGDCRVWLIDECHKLTSDAQTEFLKMLEDTPDHVYFILTTTEPQKMKPTIKNRCTKYNVNPLSNENLILVLARVCKKEKVKLSSDVTLKILDNSDGSARQALVYLNQVIGLKKEKDMLNAIVPETTQAAAFDIVKALLYNRGTQWSQMAAILRGLKDENPEQIRNLVLACVTTEMSKGNKMSPRCAFILECFLDSYFYSGRAGLFLSCWQVIANK